MRAILFMFLSTMALASLPVIFNPTPVTVPATSAVTFNDSFLVGLTLGQPNKDGVQGLNVRFRPYDHVSGAIYKGMDKDIILPVANIWVEAQRSTLFAQVMGGIIQVASLELQEKDLIKKVAADPSNAGLQSSLAAVQTALGVSAPELKTKGKK